MRHSITIRYEMWDDGNVTQPSLAPMPQIGIHEVLNVDFVDHQWVVTSTEPGASSKWVGRDEYKQVAILNYLKARLGHYEIERVEE